MIIFDEKKYAESMIKKGFQTKHKNVYELSLLAKYYFSLGLDEVKVKEKIIAFCKKFVEQFNSDEWYKIINKTVSIAKKGKLITGRTVEISESELNKIKQLNSLNEQKVAFTMLVLYKFYDCKKFEVSIEDLYRLCKLNLNSQTKLKILQSLTSQGYIDITMGGKRWAKFSEKGNLNNSVIEIKDFDNFIYEYLRYIGETGYIGCEVCNKAIKTTSSTKKYCTTCKRKSDLEKYKKYNKKR